MSFEQVYECILFLLIVVQVLKLVTFKGSVLQLKMQGHPTGGDIVWGELRGEVASPPGLGFLVVFFSCKENSCLGQSCT